MRSTATTLIEATVRIKEHDRVSFIINDRKQAKGGTATHLLPNITHSEHNSPFLNDFPSKYSLCKPSEKKDYATLLELCEYWQHSFASVHQSPLLPHSSTPAFGEDKYVVEHHPDETNSVENNE